MTAQHPRTLPQWSVSWRNSPTSHWGYAAATVHEALGYAHHALQQAGVQVVISTRINQTKGRAMAHVSYYPVGDVQEPSHAIPDDAVIVMDLPQGRLELRHQGDHLLVSPLPSTSAGRLTVAPGGGQQLALRLEEVPPCPPAHALRARLAEDYAHYALLSLELDAVAHRLAAGRRQLGALLLPHLPVGTVIERVLGGDRRHQQYQITHHGLCGIEDEAAVAYAVPINKDGTLRERGGKWLYDWSQYRIVALPAPQEENAP